MKEVELMSSVTAAPEALEEPSNKSKRLKYSIEVTRELIGQKKEQGEKSVLVQSIKGARYLYLFWVMGIFKKKKIIIIIFLSCPFLSDECQMFEDWLQDAQLAVNECFENPETREDVEASMQRLQVSKPVIRLTAETAVRADVIEN